LITLAPVAAAMGRSLYELYTDALWRTMDALGVSASVERKIVTAVGIQFAVSVAQVALPFLAAGRVRLALSALLFAGAAAAFVNTAVVVREDISRPIAALETQADAIAAGRLDGEPPSVDQADEIGGLAESCADMQAYLAVVSGQASALSRQEFDADVLDEEVPGPFGESLDRMARNLEEYTGNLRSLVREFGDAAERAGEGDLTAAIDEDAIGDENGYDEVVRNYNELLGTLGETVAEVTAFADEVASLSDQAHARVSEASDASASVSGSVREISGGAAEQTEKLQTIASELNTLSATVEEIAASADTAAETAERAAERGRSGRDAASDAIEELDDVEARIDDTAAAVERLVSRLDEIEEIVNVIDEIADETNMLALNASVEAARAGEEGAGFAVVADEVKSLAEETGEAADEVSEVIAEIHEQSAETMADVRAMNSQVSGSVDTVESALRDFEDIVDVVGDANASIQEISTATSQQAETTQDIVGMADEVASISEETTAQSETVAAAAEQQATAMDDLDDEIRVLSGRTADLRDRLDRFVVPEGRPDGTAGTTARTPATSRPAVGDD
jgi:methyl-accepting chemotaxis protein